MYAEYYALSGLPFQLTPDARFFFPSNEHNRAMAHLTYGLHQGEGFVIITGDVGAGKTMLVEYLITTIDPHGYATAKVVTTQVNADDMLRLVAAAFGLLEEGIDKASLYKRIEGLLARNLAQGKRTILLVDEAQSLTFKVLEELRMLSNILIGGKVALQCVLLGQPQFRQALSDPALEQLRQRVVASYHLGPLNQGETKSYIEHRLKMVGWKQDPDFTEGGFEEIFRFTGGIPRRVNTLCSRLMLFGFLEERHIIDAEAVIKVAEEQERELSEMKDVSAASLTLPSLSAPTANSHDADGQLLRRVDAIERNIRVQDQFIRRAMALVATFIERGKS